MTKKTGVKNRRLLFAKNSIMMLVMLVVIFLAIFAWYHINKTVDATGINVKAAMPDEVEIAKEVTENNTKKIGSWGNTINIDGEFAFSNDVTSDGLTFIIPGFNSTENNNEAKAEARKNGKIVNEDGIPSNAISNLDLDSAMIASGKTADYYSYEFYVRSKSSQIVVKPTAYLAMAAEKETTYDQTKIIGATSTRKSIYGDFTSDALVAAMRVSIDSKPVTAISNQNVATAEGAYTSNFVWNPRPDLFLHIPEGEAENNWVLQTGVTKSTTLSRNGTNLENGDTFRHNYYAKRYENNSDKVNGVTYMHDPSPDNEYTTTLAGVETTHKSNAYKSDIDQLSNDASITNGSFTSGNKHSVPTLGTTVPLIPTVNSNNQPITYTTIDNYYVFKFKLNLWIEGTDTEARRAMDTGKFNLFLEFGNS